MERSNDGRWQFVPSWFDEMDGYDKRADLSYMRSNDKNYAIGVITHKSYNLASAANCFNDTVLQLQVITNFDGLMESNEAGLRHTENWNLKLRGMKPGKYYITYFYPNEQSAPFHSDQGFGPTIPLIVDVPATYDQYIVLFMARRSGSDWMPELEDSIRKIADSYDLTEKTIEIDHLNQIDTPNFEVYPIPTNETVIIKNNTNHEFIWIEVNSSDGKEILKIKLDPHTTELSLKNFDKGIYTVKFVKDGLILNQTRIVKI